MKNSIQLVGILVIAIAVTSCKSREEKRAEIVTNNYIRFIDSVTNESAVDAITNWKTIQHYFETKSNELNIEIDNLEDTKLFDEKINPATAKYEDFRNLILEQKSKQEAGSLSAQ